MIKLAVFSKEKEFLYVQDFEFGSEWMEDGALNEGIAMGNVFVFYDDSEHKKAPELLLEDKRIKHFICDACEVGAVKVTFKETNKMGTVSVGNCNHCKKSFGLKSVLKLKEI